MPNLDNGIIPIFSQQSTETIASLGEIKVIDLIKEKLGAISPQSPEGIGDDCAVINIEGKKNILLTTDGVTFGKHFDEKITPRQVAGKLLKRNLSDIAAMGGEAGSALLVIQSGKNLSIQWLEHFIEGLSESCSQYSVNISGGDLSEGPQGFFSAYLMQTGFANNTLQRSNAQPNDNIFVTGLLGGSLNQKHYSFEPRLKEGKWLVSQKTISSMTDITDGLAKDIFNILPHSTNAHIDTTNIPISPDAINCAKASKKTPLEHAFCDGEDYELLFTLSSTEFPSKFKKMWLNEFGYAVHQIGTIHTSDNGDRQIIDSQTLQPLNIKQGYEHFR